jgi:hypothetical protein
MADIASHPSKAQQLFQYTSALSDIDFRLSFDTVFPLPNNQRWMLAAVPHWLRFNIFETLRGKQLALLQWVDPSSIATGKRGKHTAGSITMPPVKSKLQTSSRTNSSPLLSPCRKASLVTDIKSRFSQSHELSGSSPKCSFWMDIPTHNTLHPPSMPLTSPSPAC